MKCLTWSFLSSEFACFEAGEIVQVIEAMPGSVVPLAMFFYLGKILDFGELTLVLTINSVFLLKITKIGQIWLFWSNIMDFGRNDGWDWKCGIWDKNYWVTVTKYGKWWVWGQKNAEFGQSQFW